MSDKKPERPDVRHEHPLLDFPSGNGDADCPKCKGRGVVPVMIDAGGGLMWPGGGTQNCDCMFKRDLLANVQRVWKVLLNVESAEESPLLGMTTQSLWITASNYDLRRHLRYVAFRMGTNWDARVVADATLVTAWLSSKKEVFDADVLIERDGFERERPSEHYFTLVDLAVPFDLLIIRLGVKAAKNRETPNVLAEAINERELQGKPTWIVDSPIKPLGPGHICYNESILELLDGFRRVIIADDQPVREETAASQYPRPRGASEALPAAPTGGASAYTRRKGGMGQGGPQAPQEVPPEGFHTMPMEDDGERPEVPVPVPEDDDEFSVDALLADAHTPDVSTAVAGQGLRPSDEGGEAEVEELLADFPSANELGGNAGGRLPGFLKGPLTKDERLQQEKQDRREKRWRQKKDGGDA